MHTATNHITTAASHNTSRRAFARHFGEMLLAMFAGMMVLGGVAELVFAASGSSLDDASGAVHVLFMGFNMTVAMVAWMSYRGHARSRNVEMAMSMIVPSLLAAGLAAAAVLGTGGALAIQHVVMIPAMLGVMLWRYDEYAHRHGGVRS